MCERVGVVLWFRVVRYDREVASLRDELWVVTGKCRGQLVSRLWQTLPNVPDGHGYNKISIAKNALSESMSSILAQEQVAHLVLRVGRRTHDPESLVITEPSRDNLRIPRISTTPTRPERKKRTQVLGDKRDAGETRRSASGQPFPVSRP